MGGDLDPSDFVDPDYDLQRRPAASPSVAAIGVGTGGHRPPTREELALQVTQAQKALTELRARQEELERERTQLEEARRRRLEYEQGREEMLERLTRGVGLLNEAEQSARREAEQLSRTLNDLRAALEKVAALNEESWTAENYSVELTQALTTIENARMEWNAAQLKWPMLSGAQGQPAAHEPGRHEPLPRLLDARAPGDIARLGLALTWPVAVAVLVVGILLAIVLSKP